jgi:hypothetical protein
VSEPVEQLVENVRRTILYGSATTRVPDRYEREKQRALAALDALVGRLAEAEKEALTWQRMRNRDVEAAEKERDRWREAASGIDLVRYARLKADHDRYKGVLEWLVSLDDPEDVLGREERRTVTLTQIIDRAHRALDPERP